MNLRSWLQNTSGLVLIISVVCAAGIYQFFKLPVALYPETSKPEIEVRIYPDNMTTEAFRSEYGKSLETQFRAIKDVVHVYETARDTRVEYQILFDWGVDGEDAKSKIQAIVSATDSSFPKSWHRSRVRFSAQRGARFFASLKSDSRSRQEISEHFSTAVVPKLRSIEGIDQVWLTLHASLDVLVHLDPLRMLQSSLTFSEVEASIRKFESNRNLGNLKLPGNDSYQVQLKQRIKNVEELENVVLKTFPNGKDIQLRDVADVELKNAEGWGDFRLNGEETLLIGGMPKPDANIKQVAEDFLGEVKTSALMAFPDADVRLLMSPAEFINSAIYNIILAVLIGILVATLVVFLFLGAWSNTLVVCISIPVSLIGGMLLMQVIGLELNLISLGAMALAVGMVVDGSIVVLENIVRHISEGVMKPLDAIVFATAEVRLAVVASLLTTIIVFAPLMFTAPLASAILGDLAVVMVCVLIVSLVVTLCIVPGIYWAILKFSSQSETQHVSKRRVDIRFSNIFQKGVDGLQGLYLKSLRRILGSKRLTTFFWVMCASLLVGSVYVLSNHVKREILATPDSDKVFLFVNFKDPSMSEDSKKEYLYDRIRESKIEFSPFIRYMLSQTGENNYWIIYVLKDQSRMGEFKKILEDRYPASPLASFYVEDWSPTSLKIPNPADIQIEVTGGRNSNEKRATLKAISKVFDESDGWGRRRWYPDFAENEIIALKIKEGRLRSLGESTPGLTADSIVKQISSYLRQTDLFWFESEGKDHNVKLDFPPVYWNSPQDIELVPIRAGDSVIPAGELVDVVQTKASSEVYRVDGQKTFFIKSWVKLDQKKNTGKLLADLKQKLQDSKDIEMSHISFVDTQVEVNENIQSLIICFILALSLILCVVCLQFGSLIQTLYVMIAIPLGFIGMGISIYTFGSTLGINSMLGLVLLAGIAVNNSILIVDFYNQFRNQNLDMEPDVAILKAVELRFRPILITTLTTILGMLPIAFAMGDGGKILQPLGIAVSGGLGVSTLLTLFALPQLLAFHERFSFASVITKLKALLFKPAETSSVVVKSLVWVAIGFSAFVLDTTGVAATQSLSLKQAIELGLKRNSKVQELELNAQRINYEKRILWSGYLPKVSIGRKLEQQDRKRLVPTKDNPNVGEYTALNAYNFAEIKWTLDGPIRSLMESRVFEQKKKQANIVYENERVKHANSIIKMYFQTLVKKHKLNVLKKFSSLADGNFALNQKRFKNAKISRADFLRAELLFEQNRIQASKVSREVEALEIKLIGLIGGPKNTLVLTDIIPDRFKFQDYNESKLNSLLLNWMKSDSLLISEVRQRERLIQAENSSAWMDYLPKIGIGARYDWSDPHQEENYDIDRGDGPLYSLSFVWELFSGGKSYYTHQIEKHDLMQVEFEKKLVEENIPTQVSSAISGLETFKEQLNVLKKSLDLNRAIYELSRKDYLNGKGSSIDMNKDFESLLAAENTKMDLIDNLVSELKELSNSIGSIQVWSLLGLTQLM